jgi:hypothetical protein
MQEFDLQLRPLIQLIQLMFGIGFRLVMSLAEGFTSDRLNYLSLQ